MCDDINLNNFCNDVDYDWLKTYYKNTPVEDILFPMLLIDDEFYWHDYIQWVSYYRWPLIRAILYSTNIHRNQVLFDIYYDYLSLLIDDIVDDIKHIDSIELTDLFWQDVSWMILWLFKIMEWLMLWYGKK